MASHHLQSHSDPNYLLRLQNIHIDDAAAAAAKRRTNSLNNSYGGGGGGVDLTMASRDGGGGGGHLHKNVSVDYRNNILGASKFGAQKPAIDHSQGKLYASVGGYVINNSPTHSLSGSSQHSGSPRASLTCGNGGGGGLGMCVGPVYENIEYYAQPHPNDHILMYGNFESTNKKAQPQVPNNNGCMTANVYGGGGVGRFAHTPQPQDVEQMPIYENLPTATGEYEAVFVYLLYECVSFEKAV